MTIYTHMCNPSPSSDINWYLSGRRTEGQKEAQENGDKMIRDAVTNRAELQKPSGELHPQRGGDHGLFYVEEKTFRRSWQKVFGSLID